MAFEAPRHVSIKREEIHTAVSEANLAATAARAEDLLNGLGLHDPA
ncbi:hypothetical protein [Sinomonas sp. RB5]